MTETVIITRHAGLVEWLKDQGITGRVISHAAPDDVRGKIVVGTLPLHLAALTHAVIAVDIPHLPPEKRGQELTKEELDTYGARLHKYRVLDMGSMDDPLLSREEILAAWKEVSGGSFEERDLDLWSNRGLREFIRETPRRLSEVTDAWARNAQLNAAARAENEARFAAWYAQRAEKAAAADAYRERMRED